MSGNTRVPCTSRGWYFSDIPSDWKSIPLKYACDLTSAYGAIIPAERYVTEGVRFLRTTDITDRGELISGGVFISEDEATGYVLEERDLLISRSGTVGRSFLYDESYGPCAYAGYLIRYQLKRDFEPKYLFYLTKSAGFQEWIGTVSIEATIGNVNGEKYANFSFPAPAFAVQRLIANYLDRETARIDGLIAEKERMLALLEEKRAALNSRAVTRGLDPTNSPGANLNAEGGPQGEGRDSPSSAPLKPSGQDWLGEIPAHWELERLKFHLHRIEQGWSPQCDNSPAEAEEWGVLKVGAVNGWSFNPSENKRLPDEIEPLVEYEIRPGDVLMSRANTTQLLGSVSYVQDVGSKLLLCDKLYRLEVDDATLDREYLVAFMRARPGRFQLEREASGTSGSMQNIGQDTVQNAWITIPPLDEQRKISRRINHIRENTARMEEALRNSVDLLRERRAALITAAVTGQIPLETMRG